MSLLLDHGADVDGIPLLLEHKSENGSEIADGKGVGVGTGTGTGVMIGVQVEEGLGKGCEDGLKFDSALESVNTSASENNAGLDLGLALGVENIERVATLSPQPQPQPQLLNEQEKEVIDLPIERAKSPPSTVISPPCR